MALQARELVYNEPKCLLLPGIPRLVYSNQCFDFDLSFLDFTVKEMHEFLCTLDGLER